MFLRMVAHDIQEERAETMASVYQANVISVLRTQPGCVFAALFQNVINEKECFSMTIWNSRLEAAEYEHSGVFLRLFDFLRPYFKETDEMELKLNDDLSIEYTPIHIDPNVKGFDDADTQREYIQKLSETPYAAKIITLSVQPDKVEAFQDVFAEKIMPLFSGKKGFVHIILLRKENEFTIISFWDETIDLTSALGEQSLNELTKNIVAMLPLTIQWQVSHKTKRTTYVSTDELKTSAYRCLTGEWFSK